MVSAAKAFAKEPPRKPLTDIPSVVEDFQWRYVDRKKTDQVIEYCRDAPNLGEAIHRAVEARDANGKHHNHQSKVDIAARRELGRRLYKSMGTLRRIARGHSYKWDKGFDGLHDFIDSIKPYGIGPVTVYDVAVRIGAYFEVEPQSVYMHAGVRQGMKALEGAYGWPGDDLYRLPRVHRWVFVDKFDFPKSIRADDIEDILCTYREVFLTW